ncbi:MAG: 16S rRNA (adenine(1518)-N(6)/adenine(1519)-N(6))-dimethyltransferase, partial [Richelia sp. SM1_7_0]|nr:16S rRNA (adenine(1518)-N(6)/adenine(1519)-N(6))-dimethyltransferase [Richelia sp. SM1_7_0]
MRPRRELAQHWLRSDKALSSIIKTADLQDTDKVLEIGPGQGILTQQLIDKVKSLV